MSDHAPIRGKVAKILNSTELIVNRGSDDGVTVGMRFAVLDPKTENIKDPETGEELGSIYRPKTEVEIVDVQPKLAVARTFRSRRVNVGGSGPLWGLGIDPNLFLPPKWVTRRETLKTDESTWEDLDESKSFVKTGDPVEEVVNPEPYESGADIEVPPPPSRRGLKAG